MNDMFEFLAHAIIIIGPPSSGKKTLSKMIAQTTGAVLINQASLLESLPNNLKHEFSKEIKNNV